ncbi:hypothetical protein Golob_025708, partial [Gossypium lobatum]|nr:hypothetical protein [Gossypium lobatum]
MTCNSIKNDPHCLVHALKDYPTTRAILTLGGLDGRPLNKDYLYYIDWLEDVMRILDKKVVEDFIMMLWNSWNNRNNFVFCGKEDKAWVIWDRARTHCHDFWIHNLVNNSVLPLTPAIKKWEKPLCESMKINNDATVFNNKTSFGVIIHDSDGFVLGGGGGFKDEEMIMEWTELYAFEEGLKLETYKTLEMFTTADVKWDNRSCNNVADFMCKYAILNNSNMLFGMNYPKEIHDI